MSDEATFINQVIEEWQAGINREENFRRLFERYYRPVYRFFEKRGFSPDECHDLTQQAFLRVYIGMTGFRRDARFETWLFRIAANTYQKELRRRYADKRKVNLLSLNHSTDQDEAGLPADELVDHSSKPGPLDEVLRAEQGRVLREALSELPEQMRQCVMLRVYQERSHREIALVMGISVETVKAHLFQARQKLRVKLADYFGDIDF